LLSIIHRISPDLDVEAALKGTVNLEGYSLASFDTSHGLNSDVEGTEFPDRLEWQESSLAAPSEQHKSPLDGMSSLPASGAESGYLGKTQNQG
jgi:hypothetical protein